MISSRLDRSRKRAVDVLPVLAPRRVRPRPSLAPHVLPDAVCLHVRRIDRGDVPDIDIQRIQDLSFVPDPEVLDEPLPDLGSAQRSTGTRSVRSWLIAASTRSRPVIIFARIPFAGA